MVSTLITKLPRELRDKIYEMVFECGSIRPNSDCILEEGSHRLGNRCLFVYEHPNHWERRLKHVFANELLALLLVNRQISR